MWSDGKTRGTREGSERERDVEREWRDRERHGDAKKRKTEKSERKKKGGQ